MKLNSLMAPFVASLVLVASYAKADYTCAANPGIQYTVTVQSDPSSPGNYTASINGTNFKNVSEIAIQGAIDFSSADNQFNLWISDLPGMNGVGFQSTLSALTSDSQGNSGLSLLGIDATCSAN